MDRAKEIIESDDGLSRKKYPRSPLPIESTNSGSYNPGPVTNADGFSAELSYVSAQRDNLMIEEFSDGPYGAPETTTLGKSTTWEPLQQVVSAHRDQNPVESNSKTPRTEPPTVDPSEPEN